MRKVRSMMTLWSISNSLMTLSLMVTAEDPSGVAELQATAGQGDALGEGRFSDAAFLVGDRHDPGELGDLSLLWGLDRLLLDQLRLALHLGV